MTDRSYYTGLRQQFGSRFALNVALEDLAKAERAAEVLRQVLASYGAVARLPRPPAKIGDGVDERVGWALVTIEELRDALARSREGWLILANTKPQGGWIYLAPQFAQKHLQDADCALAELFRSDDPQPARATVTYHGDPSAGSGQAVPYVDLPPGAAVRVGQDVIANDGELRTTLPPFES